MPDFLFAPTPDQAAIDFIKSKPVVSREVFNGLLAGTLGSSTLGEYHQHAKILRLNAALLGGNATRIEETIFHDSCAGCTCTDQGVPGRDQGPLHRADPTRENRAATELRQGRPREKG